MSDSGDLTNETPPAKAKRMKPAAFKKPKGSAQRESICDLDAAAKELDEARRELAAIPNGLSKYQREAHLIEPLSRLSLVNRFIAGILTKHDWKPIALEGNA